MGAQTHSIALRCDGSAQRRGCKAQAIVHECMAAHVFSKNASLAPARATGRQSRVSRAIDASWPHCGSRGLQHGQAGGHLRQCVRAAEGAEHQGGACYVRQFGGVPAEKPRCRRPAGAPRQAPRCRHWQCGGRRLNKLRVHALCSRALSAPAHPPPACWKPTAPAAGALQ